MLRLMLVVCSRLQGAFGRSICCAILERRGVPVMLLASSSSRRVRMRCACTPAAAKLALLKSSFAVQLI